jgi:hypothetical protein
MFPRPRALGDRRGNDHRCVSRYLTRPCRSRCSQPAPPGGSNAKPATRAWAPPVRARLRTTTAVRRQPAHRERSPPRPLATSGAQPGTSVPGSAASPQTRSRRYRSLLRKKLPADSLTCPALPGLPRDLRVDGVGGQRWWPPADAARPRDGPAATTGSVVASLLTSRRATS